MRSTPKNEPEKAIRAYNEALQHQPAHRRRQAQSSRSCRCRRAISRAAVLATEEAVKQAPTNPAARCSGPARWSPRGDYRARAGGSRCADQGVPQGGAGHAQMGELQMARQNRRGRPQVVRSGAGARPELVRRRCAAASSSTWSTARPIRRECWSNSSWKSHRTIPVCCCWRPASTRASKDQAKQEADAQQAGRGRSRTTCRGSPRWPHSTCGRASWIRRARSTRRSAPAAPARSPPRRWSG